MTTSRKQPSPPPPAGVARVPMKSTLPDQELQRYRDSGSVIALQPGEMLFEQGTYPEEMYAVLRGTLAVIMDGVQVAEIGEGQVAGEMAFLLGQKRSATLRALDNCEVHAISPLKMRMLMQHPDVAFGLLQLFSRRVEAANQALLVRTQTARNDRFALEEEQRQRAKDREAAEARIGMLEAALQTLNVTVAQDGTIRRIFPRPAEPAAPKPASSETALELDFEDDGLDALAPPPAPQPPPLPIGKVALTQVAVPRPKPAPVFSEEGPTDVMEAATDEVRIVIEETEVEVPRDVLDSETDALLEELSREILALPTERDRVMVAAVEGPLEPDEAPTDELPKLPAPSAKVRGDATESYQRNTPVGGRTQNLLAFDPNQPMREIVVDERGTRPSQPMPVVKPPKKG